MNGEKSSLRKKLLVKRKKLFSKKLTFNFGKIVNLIKKNFNLKKYLLQDIIQLILK